MTTSVNTNKGILVIYTGGTIGSAPRDPDPDSPQIVVSWERLKKEMKEVKDLSDSFRIDAHSFSPPLDSCNIGPPEWKEMARAIYDNYDNYEGFVILHGTDTMVYTASALSFILQDLGKPVVITGAQRSAMVDLRNDAGQNFVTAALLANPAFSGLPLVPEVVICFGGLILRGNRSIKRDTSSYQAYYTPNLNPLGEAGNRIFIDEALIQPRPGPDRRFRLRPDLETNVMPIYVYPGIQDSEAVKRLLEMPGLRGVVIHAYGSGDIPTKAEFLSLFADARERGVVSVVVTQCKGGPVELGVYESSALLLEAGMIAGHDITSEAAQCKLMVLLGNKDMTQDEVEAEFQRDMAGEQSVSLWVTPFPGGTKTLQGPAAKGEAPGTARLPARPLAGHWDPQRIARALLRLKGARVSAPKGEPARFRLFVNLGEGEAPSNSHPGYAGQSRKESSDDSFMAFFDVTRAIKPIATPGERVSFTFALDTLGASFSWESAELALFIREVAE